MPIVLGQQNSHSQNLSAVRAGGVREGCICDGTRLWWNP